MPISKIPAEYGSISSQAPNFEPSSFMGFINDLLERPDWQCLFLDLPNGAGFVSKLSDFFARQKGGLKGDDGSYLYFHPLQRNSLEKDRLVQLASEHVLELARIAGLAGARWCPESFALSRLVPLAAG